MTKLELAVSRLQALSPDKQEQMAELVMQLLDEDASEFGLTPAQEAELARRLAHTDEEFIPHEEVFSTLRRRLEK